MKTRMVLFPLLLLVCAFSMPAWAQTTLVPIGASWRPAVPQNLLPAHTIVGFSSVAQPVLTFCHSWRYSDLGEEPPAEWPSRTYDDSQWSVAQGIFDAKRNDSTLVESNSLDQNFTNEVVTLCREFLPNGERVGTCVRLDVWHPVPVVVNEAVTNLVITHYYRADFDFTGNPSGAVLRCRMLLDDGGVLYLNGTEIQRLRMPAGPVTSSTPASATVGDAAYETFDLLVESLLVTGENVLAVETHQASATSSDTTFGLEAELLLSMPGGACGPLQIAYDFPEAVVTWFGSGILEESSTVEGPYSPVVGSPTNPYPFNPTGSARFFRLLCFGGTASSCKPPAILAQPGSTNLPVGESITLSLEVAGELPLALQWFRDRAPLLGATDPILTLSNLERTNGGRYELSMSNACGASFSRPIDITVGGSNTFLADYFAARPTWTGFSGQINATNVFATAEAGEPFHAGQAPGKSVWVNYLVPATGVVTFDTIGSPFDTRLAAYRGTMLATLQPVDSNDDRGSNFTSEIQFNVAAGEQIAIAVDGYRGEAGVFQLNLALDTNSTQCVPEIIAHPQDISVPLGDSFSLSVVSADPCSPMSLNYQWQHNGTNLPGATNALYTVLSSQASDVGLYEVLIFNSTSTNVAGPGSVFINLAPSAFGSATVASGVLNFTEVASVSGVASGSLTFTSYKQTKCADKYKYRALFFNPADSNGWFCHAEPLRVDAYTAKGGTALNLHLLYYRFCPRLPATCADTFTQIDPLGAACVEQTPACSFPATDYKYQFELLSLQVLQPLYVELKP